MKENPSDKWIFKAFAMTGWRLGYACGHPDLIGAMFKIHQYAIMSSPTTAQKLQSKP